MIPLIKVKSQAYLTNAEIDLKRSENIYPDLLDQASSDMFKLKEKRK